MSDTFKLIVPEDVEAKIRYLIRKFPHNEWSGILFTTHTGSFTAKNLVITCKDIYPMAAGSSGFTEFNMSEDVAAYMAQHIELFNCELMLIHSHHTMGAFLSGQDLYTLNDQGNDKNIFVSLVVDTRGKYVAAITRKVKTKKEVKTTVIDKCYMYFGECAVHMPTPEEPEVKEVVDTVIEYYMLDVERHEVEEPLAYLDERFEEIEARNRQQSPTPLAKGFWHLEDAENWQRQLNVESMQPKQPKQLDLFGGTAKPERPSGISPEDWEGADTPSFDPAAFEVDHKAVHEAVARILCCSLIINAEEVDLKRWVTRNMVKVYRKLFEEKEGDVELDTSHLSSFKEYADWTVEWSIIHFKGEVTTEHTDMLLDDYFYAAIAYQIKAELLSYGTNKYISYFCDILDNYIEMV